MRQRDRELIDEARQGVRRRDQHAIRMLVCGLSTRTVASIDGRTHRSIQLVQAKCKDYLQALMRAADAEAVQVAAVMSAINTTTGTRALQNVDSVPKPRRRRARAPTHAPWTPEQL